MIYRTELKKLLSLAPLILISGAALACAYALMMYVMLTAPRGSDYLIDSLLAGAGYFSTVMLVNMAFGIPFNAWLFVEITLLGFLSSVALQAAIAGTSLGDTLVVCVALILLGILIRFSALWIANLPSDPSADIARMKQVNPELYRKRSPPVEYVLSDEPLQERESDHA